MHFHAEVYLKEIGNVEKQIEAAFLPYNESLEIEKVTDEDEGELYWRNSKGFWDWYQIGGRWTGTHDGYNPNEDPENIEVCDICGGTGDRATWRGESKSVQHSSGCNGCMGKGKRPKWPTDYKKHQGDIIPIEKTKDDLICHTLIVGDEVFQVDVWNGKEIVKTDFDGNVKNRLTQLGIQTGYLVTVDYHS